MAAIDRCILALTFSCLLSSSWPSKCQDRGAPARGYQVVTGGGFPTADLYRILSQPGSPAVHPSVYLSPDYAPPPPSEQQHVTCGYTIHSLYNTIYQPLPTYV